jgi:hypothetical protein
VVISWWDGEDSEASSAEHKRGDCGVKARRCSCSEGIGDAQALGIDWAGSQGAGTVRTAGFMGLLATFRRRVLVAPASGAP